MSIGLGSALYVCSRGAGNIGEAFKGNGGQDRFDRKIVGFRAGRMIDHANKASQTENKFVRIAEAFEILWILQSSGYNLRLIKLLIAKLTALSAVDRVSAK
ncbi:hypothetical protein [Granulicella tundricola]|uniref:hypothetical protein n=1 Tax=Granulicella tundricola TaxID=940615 RepID=UPI0018DCD33F|nr:hypothetical protein [Granulicella tundricola]